LKFNLNFKNYLLLLLLFLSGCDAVNKAANSSNENLTYSLDVNGCQTGSHSFSSVDAYCSGLQSSSLNNGCALSERMSLFNSRCAGTFTPSAYIEIYFSKENTLQIK
jgi:hypothetical protein